MRVVVCKWLPGWWCSALTFYPWVLCSAKVAADSDLYTSIIYKHEAMHHSRQKAAYAANGWWGVAKWHLKYLFCWPFGKNDFRRQEETLAFRAQGFTDEEIDGILKKSPYFLWR